MRKILSILAISIFTLSLTTTVFAEDVNNSILETINISDNILVEHRSTPGMMGSFDTLIIKNNEVSTPIFLSEGRRIENVFNTDFDKDGKSEYLVQMDCGGSGGYRDMCILKEKEGKYQEIWEDSMAAPIVLVKDDAIYIKHILNGKEKPEFKTTVLTFANGKINQSIK